MTEVPTFFLAGHETTSNAIAWTLFALSQAPDVRKKLRQELQSFPTSHPTMDQLNSLPYLENVVREVLRFHAPVAGTMRVATEEVVIPVSEPYLDRSGRKRSEIRSVKKKTCHDFLLLLLLLLRC
jgi:cytochrome P450